MPAVFNAPKSTTGHPQRSIAIVAFDGVEVFDLIGPLDVFAMASLALQGTGVTQAPAYSIRVLAKEAGLISTSSGLKLQADAAYTDSCQNIDTLIIPGSPNVASVLADVHLADWVRYMSHSVRRLISVCTGAFMLAEAGLLNARCATTHWAFCEHLASDYPAVNVEKDRIYLREDGIATSGGITSGIDLALALVEEDWGREIALEVARYMVVFLKRPGGQLQFSNYLNCEATQHTDLRNLQLWIIENPAEAHCLESLAARVSMSTRNFSRVFSAETGMTPTKFVEKARIDAARHYLATTDYRLEKIAKLSGFGDIESMRRAFIRHMKVNPQDFRARFGLPADEPHTYIDSI